MAALRLYLVPLGSQQITVDVPDNYLVQYDDQYVDPHAAPAVTLVPLETNADFLPFVAGATNIQSLVTQYLQLKICKVEVVDPSALGPPIIVIDPSGGQCVCAITCDGTRLAFVSVTPADPGSYDPCNGDQDDGGDDSTVIPPYLGVYDYPTPWVVPAIDPPLPQTASVDSCGCP